MGDGEWGWADAGRGCRHGALHGAVAITGFCAFFTLQQGQLHTVPGLLSKYRIDRQMRTYMDPGPTHLHLHLQVWLITDFSFGAPSDSCLAPPKHVSGPQLWGWETLLSFFFLAGEKVPERAPRVVAVVRW